ncbi:Transposase zinc-binding domain-containing protein [Marinobacter sp. LV10R510-11A]|uniref:IS91 family transposase n=1 Tax=Marinobacter sp. LV10R510-11A TaxID=1415568 RepID=UPI000BB75D87|nr:transposase [Marinobacter sp. LV10R510-11A]SOB75520.1 Transposase zinc-binding domain-containing protein [Marinobacter sp. LV10R510-11A]SOB75803.1 Transposase zinc-binding domain-containing protein [Marinobacter sp. LV10R510-11A]
MITLAQILRDHEASLKQHVGARMRPEHHAALRSILACHTPDCGEVRYHCRACQQVQQAYPSCGHRSCPACQHGTNSQWLGRQRQKLLPVDYFLVTFTLPAQLRGFAWHHLRWTCHALFQAARETLCQFARNDKRLGNQLGLVGVLHTHSRRLAFHPHVHIVVPGGGLTGHHWHARAGRYLFNGRALATVFRAKFLTRMREQGFALPESIPKHWVAQCEQVGRGDQALTYLARYLYRGVLREQNIVDYDGEQVTFRYQDSQTRRWQTLTEPASRFLWRVLQHVLPKGLRRVRAYGFLHGGARKTLHRLQLRLQVALPGIVTQPRKQRVCPCCGEPMGITLWRRPCRWPGPTIRRRCLA